MQFEKRAWLRWLIAIAAVALAFRLGTRSVDSGRAIDVIGLIWPGILLLVLAAVCVFPEVFAFATAPLSRWIENIYLPGGIAEPAPLNYRLVRYYQVTRQYDLALAEYARILDDYPDEAEAYRGLIHLLHIEFNDRRGARRWLKRGLRRVREPAAKTALREDFGSLLEPVDHRIVA